MKLRDHSNADTPSRVTLCDISIQPDTLSELVLLIEHLTDASPVTTKQIELWTRHYPTLPKVLNYLQYGWPKKIDRLLTTYSTRCTERSVYYGCIQWGNRVEIPPLGRSAILQHLHESHMGMCRIKALARMYV